MNTVPQSDNEPLYTYFLRTLNDELAAASDVDYIFPEESADVVRAKTRWLASIRDLYLQCWVYGLGFRVATCCRTHFCVLVWGAF